MNARRKVVIGLAVVVTVVLAIVGAVSAVYHDGTRPGTLHAGGTPSRIDAKHKAVVQLPLGALTVGVGNPTQSPPNDIEEKQAADGAAWVPVQWLLAGQGADYDNTFSAYQFSVALVAGGRRYDLQAGQDPDDAASKYTPVVKGKSVDVVVQGAARHLKVEVGYDGVTQTLDVDSGKVSSGLAAPYYRNGGPRTALPQSACSILSATAARSFELSTGDHCRLGKVEADPYVGGLGWVGSAEQTWLLVPIDIMGLEIDPKQRDDRFGYEVHSLDYTLTVDGAKPVTELLRYRDRAGLSASSAGVVVFRTAAAPHRLTLSLTAGTSERLNPDRRRTFTSTRSYPLS